MSGDTPPVGSDRQPVHPPAPALSARDFPTNEGGLCVKGWTAATLLRSSDRLSTPLARPTPGAPLRPCSWEEALGRTATALASIQRRHGRDAVGVFGGGGLTNEKAYLLGKFARVALGTSMIDYNGRFCMSAAATASNMVFGLDRGVPFPLAHLAMADAILIVGSNPAETMPPAARHLRDVARNGHLIVIDPRLTATAELATLHLQPRPGTDLAVALGLLHVALAEGLVDKGYIEERTVGFDEVAATAMSYWPERVEEITGVPAADLRQACRLLGNAGRGIVLSGRGAEQHVNGTDTVLGFANLALSLGLPGRPYSGFASLTGQGNGQGGREHGQKADQLPGYRSIVDPAARAAVAAVWGVDPASLPGPGVSGYEMLQRCGEPGGLAAMIVMGSNPAVSAPNALAVQDHLKRLEFLAVVDPFLSETAALADVVLPSAQWAEETGTMTNLEGRVILREAHSPPPHGVRTDLEIISSLASRLGSGPGFPSDPEVVFDELGRASSGGRADYGGISHARLRGTDGLFWPCPDERHPGTPVLFSDRFATPDGRARLYAVDYTPRPADTDDTWPLMLTTGRCASHYQSGTQTRRTPELAAMEPLPYVEIHPNTASHFGLSGGDLAAIHTPRGSMIATVCATPAIRPDTIFTPFHWGAGGAANNTTSPALDPRSGMPEFKACAARIEPVMAACEQRCTAEALGEAEL